MAKPPNWQETIEVSDPSALPKSPLVSVYMLAYNHERFIAQAIEGVLAQRCDFPMELIIGEDHSSDGTRDIALAYQKQYPALLRVLCHQKNIGMRWNAYRCRNAARGKYVAICEGDDYWTDPLKLAKQVSVLDMDENVAFVFHDVAEVDSSGNILSHSKITSVTGARPAVIQSLKQVMEGAYIPTLSIVYRNVADAKKAPSSDILNGDSYLFAMLCQHGHARFHPDTMAAYRHHAGGTWSSRSEHSRALELLNTTIVIARDIHDAHAIHISRALSNRIANAYLHCRPRLTAQLSKMALQAYGLSILCPLKSGLGFRNFYISLTAVAFPFMKYAKRRLARLGRA